MAVVGQEDTTPTPTNVTSGDAETEATAEKVKELRVSGEADTAATGTGMGMGDGDGDGDADADADGEGEADADGEGEVDDEGVEVGQRLVGPIVVGTAANGEEDKTEAKDPQQQPQADAKPNAVPAVAGQTTKDDRTHSYSRPSIPAGRENSRLRIYFSSPPIVAVHQDDHPPPTTAASTTGGIGGGGGSKRKLSISAQSAMSVDPQTGGGGGPGAGGVGVGVGVKKESSMSPSKVPATGTVVEEVDGMPMNTDQEEGEGRGVGAAEGGAVGGENGQEQGQVPTAENAEDDEEEEDEEEPPMPEPSADRISISYARNTRRMVIDSDVVESVRVFRAEHRVEVVVKLAPAIVKGGKYDGEPDDYRLCKGVLVEALDQEADDYVIIDRATLEATWNAEGQPEPENPPELDEDDEDYQPKHDPLLPPLHRLFASPPPPPGQEGVQTNGVVANGDGSSALKVVQGFSKDTIRIIARLDTVNPLTEAKWVRTGDVDSWISQMTGRIFYPEDTNECGWRRKIQVADPDPAPTIQHMLDTWLTTSNVGTIETRQRFLDRHVARNSDVIIEILLRMVRGPAPSTSAAQTLITHQATTLRAPYPEQQTQISLAVLSLYRLALDTAQEANIPKDRIVKKATDIIRNLPYRMAFSSLDGIFHDERL